MMPQRVTISSAMPPWPRPTTRWESCQGLNTRATSTPSGSQKGRSAMSTLAIAMPSAAPMASAVTMAARAGRRGRAPEAHSVVSERRPALGAANAPTRLPATTNVQGKPTSNRATSGFGTLGDCAACDGSRTSRLDTPSRPSSESAATEGQKRKGRASSSRFIARLSPLGRDGRPQAFSVCALLATPLPLSNSCNSPAWNISRMMSQPPTNSPFT